MQVLIPVAAVSGGHQVHAQETQDVARVCPGEEPPGTETPPVAENEGFHRQLTLHEGKSARDI